MLRGKHAMITWSAPGVYQLVSPSKSIFLRFGFGLTATDLFLQVAVCGVGCNLAAPSFAEPQGDRLGGVHFRSQCFAWHSQVILEGCHAQQDMVQKPCPPVP